MSKPAFYKAPPKWHFFAALAGAVAIEVAAIAAGNLLGNGEIPTVVGTGEEEQPFFAVLTVDDAPEPVPDDPTPLILPPPPDNTDFVLTDPTPPPRLVTATTRKPTVHAHVSKVTGGTPDYGSGQTKMIFSPHPGYPFEARRAKQAGSGKFLLRFDAGGNVITVDVVQSTGSAILDQVSMRTLQQWRCQPGVYESVYVPVTFTLHGAQL